MFIKRGISSIVSTWIGKELAHPKPILRGRVENYQGNWQALGVPRGFAKGHWRGAPILTHGQ